MRKKTTWIIASVLALVSACGGQAEPASDDASQPAPHDDASVRDAPDDNVIVEDFAPIPTPDAGAASHADASDAGHAADVFDAGPCLTPPVEDGSIVPPPRPCFDAGADTGPSMPP
jgi:hypothetical protein